MKLNMTNIGILAGAGAVAYLLYYATKPRAKSGYIATGAPARNTDGGAYFATFQDDSAISNDYGMIRT